MSNIYFLSKSCPDSQVNSNFHVYQVINPTEINRTYTTATTTNEACEGTVYKQLKRDSNGISNKWTNSPNTVSSPISSASINLPRSTLCTKYPSLQVKKTKVNIAATTTNSSINADPYDISNDDELYKSPLNSSEVWPQKRIVLANAKIEVPLLAPEINVIKISSAMPVVENSRSVGSFFNPQPPPFKNVIKYNHVVNKQPKQQQPNGEVGCEIISRQKVAGGDELSHTLSSYPKPPYSYSCLISMALHNSDSGTLPVNDIYDFIVYACVFCLCLYDLIQFLFEL